MTTLFLRSPHPSLLSINHQQNKGKSKKHMKDKFVVAMNTSEDKIRKHCD